MLVFVTKFNDSIGFDFMKKVIDHPHVEFVFLEFLLVSKLISAEKTVDRPSVSNHKSFCTLFPKCIMSSTLYKVASWTDLDNSNAFSNWCNKLLDNHVSQSINRNTKTISQKMILISFFSATSDYKKRSLINHAWNHLLSKLENL